VHYTKLRSWHYLHKPWAIHIHNIYHWLDLGKNHHYPFYDKFCTWQWELHESGNNLVTLRTNSQNWDKTCPTLSNNYKHVYYNPLYYNPWNYSLMLYQTISLNIIFPHQFSFWMCGTISNFVLNFQMVISLGIISNVLLLFKTFAMV
jgi:hypothetical protein